MFSIRKQRSVRHQKQVTENQRAEIFEGITLDQPHRREALNFDNLRHENLEKDAVPDEQLESIVGGINFNLLCRENLASRKS